MAKKKTKKTLKTGDDGSVPIGVTDDSNLPEPSFIGNMPLQDAWADDSVNVKGQLAGGGAEYYYDKSKFNVPQIVSNLDELRVNPAYKEKYLKGPNDPDNVNYQRAYRGGLEPAQQRKGQNIAQGVREWAEYTSGYFGIPVNVEKYPRTKQSEFKTLNELPKNTMLINVKGFYQDKKSDGRTPEYREAGQDYTNQLKAGEDDKQAKQLSGYVYQKGIQIHDGKYSDSMYVNTNLSERNPTKDEQDLINQGYVMAGNEDINSSKNWAFMAQHEFGHNLGFGHPHDQPGGSKRNSVMSYYSDRSQGAKLQPADINKLKEFIAPNKKKK